MTENRIWSESARGGAFILYTEDKELIQRIRSWISYMNDFIRDMADYYTDVTGAVQFAKQFRFERPMLKEVMNASGVTEMEQGWS